MLVGKILSITGSMASTLGALNPLRYRGYVYDQETGLYYLQSRYYNPTTGRFLNADTFVSTGQGLLGNNMFAYCGNNPVVYYDPSGHAMVARKDLPVYTGYAGGVSGETLITSVIVGALVVKTAELWDDYKESIKKSLVQTQNKTYKSEYEEHHISAKSSIKAKEARDILNELYPEGVESPINKVTLKTGLHRRIHTNLYYTITNLLVVRAYKSADGNIDKARENVSNTLISIGATLKALEAFVQY